jgi:site-specific DNA-methyltransferase (adenine-specific)
MAIQSVKISDVKSNPNNPRLIKDDKFAKLVQSLKDFPEMANVRPIVVNQDFVVLGGNMRLKAMKEAGWKQVPVQVVDWSEQQQKEFIIKDNVGFGEWEWDMLANEWETEDLEKWGLDVPGFIEEPEAEEDDFAVPDGGIETDILLGDLFEIGEHRLLCGDSTDSHQVAKLMNGHKADMVFTDPPYGVNMNRSGKILNDNLTDDDLFNLINSAFVNSIIFSKDCHFYWWIGFKGYSIMEKCFIDNGIKIDNCIVWNKPSIGLGKTGYRYKHELCIFKGEIKDKSLSDVWDFGRDSQGLHPTMKPVELISYAFNNSSKSNDIILDLFGGSGSTMATAQQLNRKAMLMELDPKYCQVIVDRMLKLDPNLVIKRNGEVYVKTGAKQG